MNQNDITAILERLFREAQRAVADLGEFGRLVQEGDLEALPQHLRQLSQHFFLSLRRQLQDQTLPWLTMLRTWAKATDGATPAEILLTPLSWWQSQASGEEASTAETGSQQARGEALAAELAAARDAYLELLQDAADQAAERFGERLRGLDPEQLDIRRLYQHWLDTAEEAYEETIASEAFASATGRLANAWSELLLLLQDGLDRVLAQAGLPTRRELNETQVQIQELRRQQRQRERRLQAEIAELRAALDRLLTGTTSADQAP